MLNGFKRLEYIETSGQQYVNTSITPKGNWTIDFSFSQNDGTHISQHGTCWCARGNSATSNTNSTFIIDHNSLRFDYGNFVAGNLYSIIDNSVYNISRVKGKSYVDNTLFQTRTDSTFTAGGPIKFFAAYTSGINNNINFYAEIRFYSCQMYDENGVLIHDFVPALREADSIAGIYDQVDDTFYPSDSGTDFIAGPQSNPITFNITILGDGSVSGASGNVGDSVTLTATADAGNVFAGFFNSHDRLITLDNPYTFTAVEETYTLFAKFVGNTYLTNVIEDYFDVYKMTSTVFDSNAQLVQDNIKLSFPRVISAFNAGEGATYELLASDSIIYGMALYDTSNAPFAGHVYNEMKLSTLSDRNNIINFFPVRPWILPWASDASVYYCVRRKSDGYYFTYHCSSADYGLVEFWDDHHNKLAESGSFLQREYSVPDSAIHWNTLGFVGYESDTFTENTGVVYIGAAGKGNTKRLIIHSDSSGNLITNFNTDSKGIRDWLFHINYSRQRVPNPLDPSQIGGGDGSFEFVFDFTPIEELPERISAVSSGFVALYQIPDTATMQDLSGYLWSSDFFDNIRKFIEKPEDSLISLHILPVELSGTEVNRETMQAAGLKLYEPGHAGDSNYYIEADRVQNQYYIYDLGSIDCPEVWGSQLDYQPYTQAEIYLPYIGLQPLDIDEIAGTTLGLRYAIDLLSGDCMAFIAVDGNLKYQFSGNCRSTIPYSANSKDYLSSAITLASGLGALATGGASLAAAGALMAGGVNLFKKDISHGGGINGTRGFLSLQKAVLYLKRPNQNVPTNYGNYKGYPSNITAKLNTLSGFTVVDKIHLENIPATMEEKTEIETLLKQGVLI